MRKKQISIRDVPEALYEGIEAERHARRVSQKDFLWKVLESAATYGTGTPQPTLFDFRPTIAGVSKKNSLGRLHGFKDVSQGNSTTVEAYDVK